jgi:acetamidase/formamidase
MNAEHQVDRGMGIHHQWDNSLQPILSIRSGDVVDFDLVMAGDGQVHEGASLDEAQFDFDTIYNLSGPLFVEGAEPGDTLEIEILSLTPGEWGWTVFLPELGLLAEDFPDGYLKTWDLRGRERATLVPGVEIPLAPFLGTMGTHPNEPGVHAPFPPHKGGGNLDNRHLVAGATLWLPVWCEGALFSCGDSHAAQGDGEVCVSAIECAMQATLRFRLHKRSISTPRFRHPGPFAPKSAAAGYHATMGIGADLMQCAKDATRAMIDWLVAERGLSREDAYVLLSVAGDLKILEIVDAGVWNVGMALPLDVFVSS